MFGEVGSWAGQLMMKVRHVAGNIIIALGDAAGATRVSVRDGRGNEVSWLDSMGQVHGAVISGEILKGDALSVGAASIDGAGLVRGRIVLAVLGNTRTDTPATGETWIQRGGGDGIWPGTPWMPVDVTARYYAVEIETADGIKTIPLEPYGTTTATGSHTVTAYERVVVVNSGSAATVTLPAATGSGQVVAISSVGAGAVTVDGDGSETINGALTQTIYQYEAITVCDYASGAWTVL